MTQSRSFGLSDSTQTLKAYIDLPFILVLFLLCGFFAGWQSQVFISTKLGALPWYYEEFETFLQTAVKNQGFHVSFPLQMRFFGGEFLVLFILALFFSCASHMFFHTLHINVRRTIAIILLSLFIFCSVAATSLENQIWLTAIPHNLLIFKTPAFYLAFRAVLIGLGAFGVLFPFVAWGQNRANRIARAMVVLACLGTLVLVDWRAAKASRTIASENLSPQKKHLIVLVVPDFSEKDMSDFLDLSEITGWRDRMVGTARLLPASDAAVPQFATLLTGMLPAQHGIRSDWMEPELAQRVGQPFAQGLKKSGKNLYFSSVGSVQNTTALFDFKTPGTRCSFSVEEILDVQTLEAFLLPHALLPTAISEHLFPEYKCSQKFESLADLHRQELNKVTEELKVPAELNALFWVDPNAYLGLHGVATAEKISKLGPWQTARENPFSQDSHWDSNQSAARARLLAQVFAVYDDYLHMVGLNLNTRLVVTGLSSRNAQPVSAVVFDAHPDESLKALLAKNMVLPQSTLTQILGFGKPEQGEANNGAIYESLRFPSSESSDASAHFALPLEKLFELRESQNQTSHIPILPSLSTRLMIGYSLRAIPCSVSPEKNQSQPVALFWSAQGSEKDWKIMRTAAVHSGSPLVVAAGPGALTQPSSEAAKKENNIAKGEAALAQTLLKSTFPNSVAVSTSGAEEVLDQNLNPNYTFADLQPPLEFAFREKTRLGCERAAREKLAGVVQHDVDLLDSQLAFSQLLKAKLQ